MHDVFVVAILILFLKWCFGLKWLILTFGDPKARRGSLVFGLKCPETQHLETKTCIASQLEKFSFGVKCPDMQLSTMYRPTEKQESWRPIWSDQ